jgi:hypothetical protein
VIVFIPPGDGPEILTRLHGRVADFCPVCRGIAAFRLYRRDEHFLFDHRPRAPEGYHLE